MQLHWAPLTWSSGWQWPWPEQTEAASAVGQDFSLHNGPVHVWPLGVANPKQKKNGSTRNNRISHIRSLQPIQANKIKNQACSAVNKARRPHAPAKHAPGKSGDSPVLGSSLTALHLQSWVCSLQTPWTTCRRWHVSPLYPSAQEQVPWSEQVPDRPNRGRGQTNQTSKSSKSSKSTTSNKKS